jgi:hypothetical protein
MMNQSSTFHSQTGLLKGISTNRLGRKDFSDNSQGGKLSECGEEIFFRKREKR